MYFQGKETNGKQMNAFVVLSVRDDTLYCFVMLLHWSIIVSTNTIVLTWDFHQMKIKMLLSKPTVRKARITIVHCKCTVHALCTTYSQHVQKTVIGKFNYQLLLKTLSAMLCNAARKREQLLTVLHANLRRSHVNVWKYSSSPPIRHKS